jgi:hypothetical protein
MHILHNRLALLIGRDVLVGLPCDLFALGLARMFA